MKASPVEFSYTIRKIPLHLDAPEYTLELYSFPMPKNQGMQTSMGVEGEVKCSNAIALIVLFSTRNTGLI